MINAIKTRCIFIGIRQLCPRIPDNVVVNSDGTSISSSTHVKNLCLYMSFVAHFREISKKIMGMLIYVNRISTYLEKKSRIIVIQFLSLPTLIIASVFWGYSY